MYLMILTLFNISVFSNVLVFQLERALFLREHANQMYSLPAYYLTKMLIEIPILLLQPLIMQIIVYWAIGYR